MAVNNSYATGYVRGGSGDDKVGGLAGVGSVTNSYSIATVDGGNGTDTVSHLVASVSGTSTVTDSYYDNDSSKLMGGTVQPFGTGKTSAEFKRIDWHQYKLEYQRLEFWFNKPIPQPEVLQRKFRWYPNRRCSTLWAKTP